jgi:predicted ATPase
LRRIRETSKNYLLPKNLKISKDDISIYYFEPVSEGHTVVKSIRVDRHGELLDLWPGGFFSERDSELFS